MSRGVHARDHVTASYCLAQGNAWDSLYKHDIIQSCWARWTRWSTAHDERNQSQNTSEGCSWQRLHHNKDLSEVHLILTNMSCVVIDKSNFLFIVFSSYLHQFWPMFTWLSHEHASILKNINGFMPPKRSLVQTKSIYVCWWIKVKHWCWLPCTIRYNTVAEVKAVMILISTSEHQLHCMYDSSNPWLQNYILLARWNFLEMKTPQY